MGMDMDPEVGEKMLNDWIKFGLARHGNFMEPEHLAIAIETMVTMPRGAHMREVEWKPKAPSRNPNEPISDL